MKQRIIGHSNCERYTCKIQDESIKKVKRINRKIDALWYYHLLNEKHNIVLWHKLQGRGMYVEKYRKCIWEDKENILCTVFLNFFLSKKNNH